jgi:hypothetical protein
MRKWFEWKLLGGVGSTMLGWNLLGLIIIVLWTVLTTGLTFGGLRALGFLRVGDAVLISDFSGTETIDMHEHGEAAYTKGSQHTVVRVGPHSAARGSGGRVAPA